MPRVPKVKPAKAVVPGQEPPFHSPTYRKAYNHALSDALEAVRSEEELEGTPPFEVIKNVVFHPVFALRGAVKATKAGIQNKIGSLYRPE